MTGTINYSAKANVYFLPRGPYMIAQNSDWLDIPFAQAIQRVLKLQKDRQDMVSIEIAGRSDPIAIEEVRAIARRKDFPAA
jgi:hypothetical protein